MKPKTVLFFLKASALPEGTERTWGGVKYRKINKKWQKVSSGKHEPIKLSPEQLVSHAENTSGESLKKIISDESKHPHLRDAAKRELERRKSDKEKSKPSVQKPAAINSTQDPAKPKVKKKKKEHIKFSPNPDLRSEHSEVEKRFGKDLNKNFEKRKSQYIKDFGHVLNTDNARELSDDYKKNKSELSAAVHEPASSFIKKLYSDMLAEKTPKGKRNLVYFTAGGTGAGKTSGLQGKEKSFHDKAHIVFDTNMNTMGSASSKIDQALSAGKKVRINYTFRDPVEAFSQGAVPRAIRIGRTVPIESHIETHLGSLGAIQGLKDKYKGNKNVEIVVTDNSRGLGNAKKSSISFVKQQEKKYVASDLREKLHSINKDLYERGEISESHYKGFRG